MNVAKLGLGVALMAGSVSVTAVALSGAPVAEVLTTEKPASVVVGIENFRFSPAEVTVPAGAVVRWVNKDDVPHTVTGKGAEPAFDSRALDTDEAFSFAFKKPGVYPYYCKVHPHMTGKVIVK